MTQEDAAATTTAKPPPEPNDDRTIQQVVNAFFGRVDVGRGEFGIRNGPAGERSTGTFTASSVDRGLDHYVRPPAFETARLILTERRVACLVGPRDHGKRVGAFALLRAVVGDADPVGLSPAASIRELADRSFQAGRPYFVIDQVRTGLVDETDDFEAERLVEKVRQAGAFLVITTTDRRAGEALTRHSVDWDCPTPIQILRARTDVPDDLEPELETALPAGMTPRQVSALAAGLRPPLTTESVRSTVSEFDGSSVSQWFDTEPRIEDLALVIAVAFAHSLPERAFEQLYVRLERALRAAGTEDLGTVNPRPGVADLKPVAARERRPLPQARRLRAAGLPFLSRRSHDTSPAGSDRRLEFQSEAIRRTVLREAWDRYDFQLWDPVAGWIFDVIRTAGLDALAEVTRGLALLSTWAWREVADRYLEPWSEGSDEQQTAAALTLWWLCEEDSSQAATGLALCRQWIHAGVVRQRVTAIHALSGPLGLQFPGDALRDLWHLAVHGGPLNDLARAGIRSMFAAASASGDGGPQVVRFVAAKLQAIDEGRRDPRERQALYELTLGLLRSRVPNRPVPAAAVLLRGDPSCIDPLAAIWRRLLTNSLYRRDAAGALREVVVALSRDPTQLGTVTRFGTELGRSMSPDQVAAVRESLNAVFAAGPTGRPDFVALLHAFLAALIPPVPRAGRADPPTYSKGLP